MNNRQNIIGLLAILSVLLLTTGCCSPRFVFLNVGKYDSIARKAIADSHPGVAPDKLDCRRFEYEDNRVWRNPDSTILWHFVYYATNDTVYYKLPSKDSRTVPTYNITLEQNGSIRRMSAGSHSYNLPEHKVEQVVAPYGAQVAESTGWDLIETNSTVDTQWGAPSGEP